jgi:hypothetical protein
MDAMKKKKQSICKYGIFLDRYNWHHQQGISPLDPRSCRGKSWLNYRIFVHHVELVDTTNKMFLLETTNKGFLLMFTMMNFQRADLIG